MGKIPAYQRDKFASTYVGAPQLDTSGVQAVEGINKAVAPITDIAATEMHNKEVARIDQQANNALVHYSLAYQQQMKDLEKEYANDPGGFPTAVAELGQNLQNEYAQNIPDGRIRTRFSEAATGVVKQSSMASLNWAAAKEEENALVAWSDSLDVAAQTAGTQSSEEGFKNSLSSIATIARSNPLISGDTQLKEMDRNLKQAKQNYFRGQAIDNSVNFERDMVQGKYDVIEFTDANGKKHSMTTSRQEKEEYQKLAQDAQAQRRDRQQHQQLIMSEGKTRDLIVGYMDGKVGLAEVVAHQDQVNADPNSTKEEKDNANEAAKFARTVNRKEGVPDPLKLLEVQSESVNLMKDISKKKKKPQKFLNELLELNTRTTQYMNSGEISETEGKSILKQISPFIAQAIDKGAPWNNPFSRYYGSIEAKVKNYSGITDRTRKSIRAEAFQGFIARKLATEEETPGVKLTSKEYNTMAEEALAEATRYVYPSTAATDEPTNSVASKNGGVTNIHNNPTTLRGDNTVTSKRPKPGAERIVNGQLQRVNEEGTAWIVVKNAE